MWPRHSWCDVEGVFLQPPQPRFPLEVHSCLFALSVGSGVPHGTLEAVKMMRNKEKTVNSDVNAAAYRKSGYVPNDLPWTMEIPLKLTLFFFTTLPKHTQSSIFCTVFRVRRKRSHFPVDRKVYHSCFNKRGENVWLGPGNFTGVKCFGDREKQHRWLWTAGFCVTQEERILPMPWQTSALT